VSIGEDLLRRDSARGSGRRCGVCGRGYGMLDAGSEWHCALLRRIRRRRRRGTNNIDSLESWTETVITNKSPNICLAVCILQQRPHHLPIAHPRTRCQSSQLSQVPPGVPSPTRNPSFSSHPQDSPDHHAPRAGPTIAATHTWVLQPFFVLDTVSIMGAVDCR
jgi:hypothetical protein